MTTSRFEMTVSEGFEGEPDADTRLDHLSSISQTNFCPFGAPLIASIVAGQGKILQTCCNHWECPVCGMVRAEREYRTIVHGSTVLSSDHNLYFWTITCRGKEISLEEAEENYYAWCNKLLTNARAKAKRCELFWAYVAVTERQKKTRMHPHSHIITTFCPDDGVVTRDASGRRIIVSSWFAKANASAGLGSQCRITQVDSAIAVARYVAKYMRKQTMFDVWPSNWHRVRYSRNWPRLPEFKPDFMLVLKSRRDWEELDDQHVRFECANSGVYEYAMHRCASAALVKMIDMLTN